MTDMVRRRFMNFRKINNKDGKLVMKKKPLLIQVTKFCFIVFTIFFIPTTHATVVSSGAVLETSSLLIVGDSGNGTFEVNSSSSGNGITSVNKQSLFIGRNGGNGTVNVIGNGISGSASINVSEVNNSWTGTGSLHILNGGVVDATGILLGTIGRQEVGLTNIDGTGSILRSTKGAFIEANQTVNITNGGLMESSAAYIGSWGFEGLTTNVSVTNSNSILRADTFIKVGTFNNGTISNLNVSDGGKVEVISGSADFPDSLSISTLRGQANVNVSGTGSILNVPDIQIGGQTTISGFRSDGAPVSQYSGPISVGQHVTDEQGNLLFDENGNPVLGVNTEINGFNIVQPATSLNGNEIFMQTTGSLTVENNAVVTAQVIQISENPDPTNLGTFNGQGATLTVRHGGVVNGDVFVNEDGLLNGDGTINGNVTVSGGTIAAGNSPGTLTIDGDLIANSGILELEIGTTGQDLLDVNGDVILGSGLVIDLFIDTMLTDLLSIESFFTGYNSFNIEAGFDPLTDIHLFAGANSGFVAGDNLRIGLGGQEFLLSFNQTSTVPTPGILALLILGLGALSLSRRRTEQPA